MRPTVVLAEVVLHLLMLGWFAYWIWAWGVPLPRGWVRGVLLWLVAVHATLALACVFFKMAA